MKKLTKILFALIIMSTAVFTSCVDYTVPYSKLPLPPGYGGVVAQKNTEFENVVIGKIWYSRLFDNPDRTKSQVTWTFDVGNHTFLRTTYTWRYNSSTNKWTDRTIVQEYAAYGYTSEIGKILYRITESNYHPISTSQTQQLIYIVEGAHILTMNSRQYISKQALLSQSVTDYTDKPTFNL